MAIRETVVCGVVWFCVTGVARSAIRRATARFTPGGLAF